MLQNNFTWREYRTHTTMFGKIPFFTDSLTTKTPSYRHHVSMYGISAEDVSIQRKLGNTKNRRVQHYSKELIIDTDSHESAEKVWEELCRQDYYFELWKLNNYKFFLLRDEKDKPCYDMCYQDKQFVRDLFYKDITQSKIDIQIYSSPFHLIRAKNSIHEVTGARSVLIDTFNGNRLISTNDVTLKPIENFYEFDPNLSSWSQLQLIFSFANGKSNCNHLNIWQLARDLFKNCSYDTALEIILIYAKHLDYDENKAVRAFNQVYKGNI